MARDRQAYNAYQREYQLRRYHARREEAINYLGNMCAWCGDTENLQIDHIDPYTKSFPISKLWSISYDKYKNELRKCQLLCVFCHNIKTKCERGQPIVIEGKRYVSIREACRKLHIGYDTAIKISTYTT